MNCKKTSDRALSGSGSRAETLRFQLLPDQIGATDFRFLNAAYEELRTAALLEPEKSNGPIVVHERDTPGQVCRLEYLVGSSPDIAAFVKTRIEPLISNLVCAPVRLFKDKCNEKNPGGGAFAVHQDMAAYQHFGPTNFFTAMVPLDPASRDNGCLNVSTNFDEPDTVPANAVDRWIGGAPLIHFDTSGPDNGAIPQEACDGLTWRPIEMTPGDVLIFDAFIPHFSERNLSAQKRRALFLTFNRANEGNHYARYYEMKRRDTNNPIFHVATPTGSFQ